jgi:Flp pilus assembly protein TadG
MTPRRPFSAIAFRRDQRGATAAEFALIVPVFLALIFLTINGAIMLSAVIQTHYAAERAARCLSVNISSDCTSGAIDTYAKGFYNGPSLTGMLFTADTAATCGSQVTGSGSYTLITGLTPTTVNISATACYPKI